MQARFYMPAVGRFIQPDTIVPDPMNPQSLNRYSYVLNNPLRYTDPTGRFAEENMWMSCLLACGGGGSSAPHALTSEALSGFDTTVVDHFRNQCKCEPRDLWQYQGAGVQYLGVLPIISSRGTIFRFPERIAGLLGIAPEVSFAAEFDFDVYTFYNAGSGSTSLLAGARVTLHDPSNLLDVWVQAGGIITPGSDGDAIDIFSKGYGRGTETRFGLTFKTNVSGRIADDAIQELEVGFSQLRSPNAFAFGTRKEKARVQLELCRGPCPVSY